MAVNNAFQQQYRDEFIAGFEAGKTASLRNTVVTESVIKGNEATFLVADTGGREAVTRGANGMIPAAADNLVQNSAILTEWHDKPRRTNFNIFASQGDGRRIMQQGTIKVINRKIDGEIISNLNKTTLEITANATNPLVTVGNAITVLGNNDVDVDDMGNMFGVITPAFLGSLYQADSFKSVDFVNVKALDGTIRQTFNWYGINWIVSSLLPNVGTNAARCFIYHRNAIGYAVNSGEMDVKAGYNDEDDYYWARSSIFMGGALLQNNGVVRIINNDSVLSKTN